MRQNLIFIVIIFISAIFDKFLHFIPYINSTTIYKNRRQISPAAESFSRFNINILNCYMLVPLRFVSLFLKPLPIQLSNNLRRVSGDDGVGATSLVATLAAPTMAFSPMVTPGRMVTPAPFQAFLQMRTSFTVRTSRS